MQRPAGAQLVSPALCLAYFTLRCSGIAHRQRQRLLRHAPAQLVLTAHALVVRWVHLAPPLPALATPRRQHAANMKTPPPPSGESGAVFELTVSAAAGYGPACATADDHSIEHRFLSCKGTAPPPVRHTFCC